MVQRISHHSADCRLVEFEYVLYVWAARCARAGIRALRHGGCNLDECDCCRVFDDGVLRSGSRSVARFLQRVRFPQLVQKLERGAEFAAQKTQVLLFMLNHEATSCCALR